MIAPLKMKKTSLLSWFVAAFVLGGTVAARAQWVTQSIDLKPGWNAVFVHVDANHTTLAAMISSDPANPILEIWRWNPVSVGHFTASPTQPTAAPEWATWRRNEAAPELQRLSGDMAYLVRVGTNVPSYAWQVKGLPVAPRHEWTITGLNLIGFPTVTNNPPKFDAFLGQSPELQSPSPEIYQYPGGELGVNNPALVPSSLFRLIPVKRGQAFWMRSGTVFNRYFGPFEVVSPGINGIDFGSDRSSATLRLRNLSSVSLTVTLRLGDSEAAPAGQAAIVGAPPLLLRGALNTTNLTYGYTNVPVNTARTWTLAPRNQPGSEVDVVLGLNRSVISAPVGSLLAGILRFTDSMGHTQVEIPVAATAAASAGLWVGNAAVAQVGQYLKTYAHGFVTNYVGTATNGDYVVPNAMNTAITVTSNSLITATNGRYVVTGTNTALGAVPRSYPLRLIVHSPASGDAVLLQRTYVGLNTSSNVVVATGESALDPARLKNARRVSSTHLPWTTTNTVWSLNGRIGSQTNLVATVTVDYDDRISNPFLHIYHPDHDNLDVQFANVLPRGSESYTVERAITLNLQPPANDFSSLVAGADTVTGEYLETITVKGLGTSAREYRVRGGFSLTRISQVPTLTLAP